MKTILMMLSLGPCLSLLCQAQPVRLTGLDRAGNLTWTNLLCVTEPVYELFQTPSLTSSWEHVAFVTNHTRFSISNMPGTVTGSVFLTVACVHETPLVFDYAFTEPELGLTTVTGRLEVAFTEPVGRRSFRPTEFYDSSHGMHPIGDAPLAQGRLPYSRDGTSLRVFLTGFGGEGTLYLDGTLERSQPSGGCPYHRYSGVVWYVGFETQGIGTFVATPVP